MPAPCEPSIGAAAQQLFPDRGDALASLSASERALVVDLIGIFIGAEMDNAQPAKEDGDPERPEAA